MSNVTYHVIEHDGGYAYKVGDTISETFPSHDDALRAARIAASEQRIPDEDRTIEYQDARGSRRLETSQGNDRPETDVDG
ncbi:DUF2188 domain-containing protein [Methylobacterium gnaphalii]|nr:DUF2188 domain-containing protein [Methylobacterium gnaphalii]GJD69762.1 hypothetical protein MMMDOFMJ_2700 [Methylobacterium gnaphalii]